MNSKNGTKKTSLQNEVKLQWQVAIKEDNVIKHYKAYDTIPNIFNRIKNYFNHVKAIKNTENTSKKR